MSNKYLLTKQINVMTIKKLTLDAKNLSYNQMRSIRGGSGCSAKCSNGNSVSISDCNGTCTAVDASSKVNGYTVCVGKTETLTKACN